ncbi:hypothetical protein F0562_019642 [Nyssa sinensis]|uniref:Uncharacterized protein n=1 Tax=Nyssa sinensis TaxID=561372 RepID=A0A5J5BP78_9ASTE|nr:hypothetical protein F0562_019642 [Nyssa sinensis]
MAKQSLIVDAWIREAEEASRLLEDLETRVKNKKHVHEERFRLLACSKLSEIGVKLDRLESLLLNPPSKPVLTDRDLDFRWKMIADIKQRTSAVAVTLLASTYTNRAGRLPSANMKETIRNIDCQLAHDQDHTKVPISEEALGLQKPLISTSAAQSQLQIKLSGSPTSTNWLCKASHVIFVIVGAVILLFVLVIIYSVTQSINSA